MITRTHTLQEKEKTEGKNLCPELTGTVLKELWKKHAKQLKGYTRLLVRLHKCSYIHVHKVGCPHWKNLNMKVPRSGSFGERCGAWEGLGRTEKDD